MSSLPTPFRCMLAGTADPDNIRFPVLASVKLDGIRCTVVNGVPRSRSGKLFPNQHLNRVFERYGSDLNGCDGELTVGSPCAPDVYRVTNSALMTIEGEPDFRFRVFDNILFPNEKFRHRLEIAKNLADIAPFAEFHKHLEITGYEMLRRFEEFVVGLGYEGVMLRDPEAPYKFGRSSTREGWLLKLKRFEDGEAEVVDFEERYHNANEATLDERGYTKRSSHQANQIPTGKLGSLLVVGRGGRFDGVRFRIGTGFDDFARQAIWDTRAQHVGRLVKYKYLDVGVKDAPRHPVFVGFRDERDLS